VTLEEDTYSIIFSALKHPSRRKIIRILDEGSSTYTELQKELDVETGYLNYYLESLEGLISKTAEGRYCLSELGRSALGLVRRVEESSTRPASRKVQVLGYKAPLDLLVFSVIAVLAISSLGLAHSIRIISNTNKNALGWAILEARGSYRESINLVRDALDRGCFEMGAVNILQNDMIQASRLLRIVSVLDKGHREQWEALKQASDSLAQASMQLMGKMASNSEHEINISFGQEFHLERIYEDLVMMENGFPDDIQLGSSPEVVVDDELMTETVEAVISFEDSINGFYGAFELGRTFQIFLGEEYF
jgi:DNA-binding transcriptional ArsR family regulator